MQTKQIVEALLFASDAPLAAADIARADGSLEEEIVRGAIQELRQEYEAAQRAFQVYELAGGFQILTRPDYAPYLERFATVSRPSRLSPAALEVLAIIAYRQPLGRAEIEEIRGVGSSGVLRTLQERELIDVVGRGEGLGRPLLYGVTERFLEHFGLRSMDDLPRPEELPVVLRDRVEALTDAEEEPAGLGEEEEAPPQVAGEVAGEAPDAPGAAAPEEIAAPDEDPAPEAAAPEAAAPPEEPERRPGEDRDAAVATGEEPDLSGGSG